MKINGNISKFYYYAFPMQAVLVTCNDEKGETNAITIAWHTPVSKNPPLYGISVAPSRYSHGLIQKTKEFVVNFVPYEQVHRLNFCGKNSGRNIEKIREAGLTLIPSQELKTLIIKEQGIKTAFLMIAFILPFAFLVGGILNLILRGLGVNL